MPIDPSIPLQVQPFKTESSANQLAMMESAAKLGEYQQNIQRTNALRGLDRTDPNYINKVYQIDPATGMKMEAHVSTIKKETAQATKAETENVSEHIKLRRDALGNVTTPEEFKAWSADNYKVPALRDYFAAQGMTSELSQAKIDQALKQPGGFQQLLGSAMLGSGELYKRNNMTASEKGNLAVSQGNLAVNQYNATKPVYDAASGGFITRPTEKNPTSTVIPLANPEATTKGQVIAKGKNLVNDVATDMATSYGVLKDLGGIKSRENSPQKNMSAALQSSTVGQIGGSLMGTPEQDARDAIKSQRPILVQAIVKATGMSSQQINSNQELKNMLDAATDPGLGYETNIKTLNKINKRFGLGGNVAELPSTTSNTNKVSVGAPQTTNPNIDALLKKYE